ncbi:MAG: lipid-A-disaccharide synthase [bacterium]|nr:lipid-A-disaccharide synthase [bacterium]
MTKLLIVTGESSGDLHSAYVIKELKKLIPNLRVFGIGGDRLKEEGVELVYHIKDTAVVGFLEVIPKFFKIRRAMKLLYKRMIEEEPDLCLLIDYPGFNLRVAKLAKRRGIRVVYYILPQVWAWGRWRLRTIYRWVDKGISILPFELEFYKKMEVEFVGHPLLDIVIQNSNNVGGATLAVAQNERVGTRPTSTIAILPGSRNDEVKHILPVMLECTKQLKEFNFVLPVAQGIDIEWVKKMVKNQVHSDELERERVQIVQDNTYEVLSNSKLALVSSGTATLEACILEVPMVIIYKVSLISYILARLLVRVPWIGLVNIIAGTKVVPEFIQFNATPKKIVKSVNEILAHGEETISKLIKVKEKLGPKGVSRRVAQILYKTILYPLNQI